MSEWLTYGIGDFLLFSPRVYWRMFELHNRAVWPAQVPALLFGVVILVGVVRPRRWSDRAIPAILAAAWLWVAGSFLWVRYMTINWAAAYVVPAFVAEGLLVLVLGGLAGRLRVAVDGGVRGWIGLALFLYALVAHPLVALIGGRPLQVEIFGIAPDPLAIATLGLLTLGTGGGVAWLLSVVPAMWCVISGVTLFALGAVEGWIPLVAVAIAATSRLWPTPDGRRSPVS
ncbi:DUF6064 family protein [Shumkonia mesophila]|uniref:DUF6064 family protein n=1 Tax=Shumkonia mesophila TaxID=2838854 RepID=UPI002934A516|nr:DUF6064 family protein [Shumkonia mesophila]